MIGRTNRVRTAENIALEEFGLDLVYDYHESTDFVEIVGSSGGDARTLRIYDNGLITER